MKENYMTPALTALLMHHSQLAPFRKRQSNVAVKVICIFIYVHTCHEAKGNDKWPFLPCHFRLRQILSCLCVHGTHLSQFSRMIFSLTGRNIVSGRYGCEVSPSVLRGTSQFRNRWGWTGHRTRSVTVHSINHWLHIIK